MDVWPAALIVDDFRTMTEIMSRILKKIGFTDIDSVQDGHSALDRLRAKRYGLVLSDWEMKPMNGRQLIEQMRRDLSISNIPVILVTATQDQDHSWLASGDRHIVKPFTAEALREKIVEVLPKRSDVAAVPG
jgi:two-component system, chemotaxis family, chemotaxis protein CheY